MKRLPIGVMIPTLVIGVMALFMTLPEFFVSLKKPVDFNELVESEIHAGLHVEGEVYAILDTFATEETWTENSNGSRTPAKTSGYFYIIPIGDESYIGLQGNGDNRAAMKAIDTATWNYLTGVTEDIEGDTYHFEGHIEKMDDELYQYFTEWFEDMEYFGAGNESMISQCALPLMIEPMSPGMMPLVIVGFAMIALNILFVVLHMNYKKKAAAAKAASAAEPWTAPAPSGDYSAPAAPQQPSAPASGDPWDAPDKQ